MEPPESLLQLAISPSGFVFDPRSGATFSLNESGRLIVEGLRDGDDLASIVRRLEDRFDTAGADLQRDVLELVRLLQEHGLVQPGWELA
ncbi:MAG TPA: HPr-rel-A system PqqD family peptide chaperone [Myxococcota bacterium]|nr:HPr-rel-A system PqqD family peptide chaperone [Myxococcota bacterium]